MGCCFSKKRRSRAAGAVESTHRCEPEDRSPPSPEVETVKEVLSETPSAKPVANVVATKDREVEKLRKDVCADAKASDLGSCASLSLATDEVSEAASESSIATSSVGGPDRSPGRKRAPTRPLSADLGGPAARRHRAGAAAASYGVHSRSARGSPSPPPRQRSVRRSPSPAAKRPSLEQRRAASPAAPAQRKPPVPVRSSGRVSPRRTHAEAPPPAVAFAPSPTPTSQPEEDAMTVSSEVSVPSASVGGGVQDERAVEEKESLENPLMSLECFIFL
jgi:hypothetical protein